MNALPKSWSELTWSQLLICWCAKNQYGGNADVARCVAMLHLLGLTMLKQTAASHNDAGESVYTMIDNNGQLWQLTPRELSYYAKKAMPWFDYPYGDQGEKEQRDRKGKVIRARREPVAGYVSPMRDAMILPIDNITVSGYKLKVKGSGRQFALPQVACNNLTWQQYRSVQVLIPQLFSDNNSSEETAELQAKFLANILTPRSLALFDTNGGSIRFHPHYEYRYNADQAEGLERWWKKGLTRESSRAVANSSLFTLHSSLSTLFHICFQAYQTAVQYYSLAYPLLFSEDKSSTMRDALQNEVGTINTIMKYAGYAEQQQVYDSNLPFVLDILNTMAKEAKEIEKMNSKIKRK